MSTIKNIIGGASISVEIQSASSTIPCNPRIAPDIQAFLSMMEKAELCRKDLEFSRCLAAFLEEVDNYLDDDRLGRDEPTDPAIVEEMEKFMNKHLPRGVRENLKKLGSKR